MARATSVKTSGRHAASVPPSRSTITASISPGAPAPTADCLPSLAEAGAPYQSAASYARHLRPLLPPGAFRTDPNRLLLVLINLAILGLGWAMADQLDRWPGFWPLAFLPFALVMGNSVIVLLFATHDLLHGSSLRGRGWRRAVGLLGLTLLWMPPTLWHAVHNREHHSHTNSLRIPIAATSKRNRPPGASGSSTCSPPLTRCGRSGLWSAWPVPGGSITCARSHRCCCSTMGRPISRRPPFASAQRSAL